MTHAIVRIEFEGEFYHVTSRGDRREPIYEDENDRSAFLDFLREVAETANWICHGGLTGSSDGVMTGSGLR